MKKYFNFNRKDKIGVIALCALIILLTVLLNVGSSTYVPNPLNVDESKLSFIGLNQEANEYADLGDGENANENDLRQALHDFDPNSIALKDWVSLGFSQKQAESIIAYRDRFGPFKRKDDLKNIYVISDKKFAEIEPFIKISQRKNQNSNSNPKPISRVIESVELNTASLEQLMTLKGIGEGYGNRIINYRNKIGGFIDFEQIETLSISDDAKAILRESAVINTELVRKTNINNATKSELKSIPFGNWLVVSSILKQRDLASLTNLDFLGEEEISKENKIKFEHYISF